MSDLSNDSVSTSTTHLLSTRNIEVKTSKWKKFLLGAAIIVPLVTLVIVVIVMVNRSSLPFEDPYDFSPCSKQMSDGRPGDGDGSTQGNCKFDEICYGFGFCSPKCSKSPVGGKPGDGNGTTQGNCRHGEFCMKSGVCSGKFFTISEL